MPAGMPSVWPAQAVRLLRQESLRQRRDLVRWDAALCDGTLIPCDIYEEAYVSGELNAGDSTGYAFGWESDTPNVRATRGARATELFR